MTEPLEVEVIAYVLGSMNHCSHCQVFLDGVGVGGKVHQADLDSYPEDLRQDWQRLSDLVFSITEKFAGKIVVRITDAQSPQAMWKALRRGVHRYPTFLVGGDKLAGLNEGAVERLIEAHLPQA